MNMLTRDEVEKYRVMLTMRQRKAEAEFEELADRCEPVAPDQALGRLTRNDAMQDQQVALHQRQRLHLQQTQIMTALDRLQKGIFGQCVLCKQSIDPRRLDLVPESPLCVRCLEKRNKTDGVRNNG